MSCLQTRKATGQTHEKGPVPDAGSLGGGTRATTETAGLAFLGSAVGCQQAQAVPLPVAQEALPAQVSPTAGANRTFQNLLLQMHYPRNKAPVAAAGLLCAHLASEWLLSKQVAAREGSSKKATHVCGWPKMAQHSTGWPERLQYCPDKAAGTGLGLPPLRFRLGSERNRHPATHTHTSSMM